MKTGRSRAAAWALSAACVAGAAGMAAGDTVVRKDGKAFQGQIVSMDDKVVALQIVDGGVTMQMKFAREQVSSVVQDVKYYEAALLGKLGTNVHAADVQKVIDAARAAKVTHVVLRLTTQDGSETEAIKGAAMIREAKDLVFIAHVEEMTGTSGALALACKHVVMMEGARVRGVKLEGPSASATRNLMKTIAERGGHPGMLGLAMVSDDPALALEGPEGAGKLVESATPGSRSLRDGAGLLVLNGPDAVTAGLAVGVTSEIAKIGGIVGAKGWREYRSSGSVAGSLAAPERKVFAPTVEPTYESRSGPRVISRSTPRTSTTSTPAQSGGYDAEDARHNERMQEIQQNSHLNPQSRKQQEEEEGKRHFQAKYGGR